MKRLAVLGAGNHSTSNHGPALKLFHEQHPDRVELAAVCDRDPGKAKEYAKEFGFAATHCDLDDMLAAERLDGIVAVTPIDTTATIAERLMSHGIPALIEKPPGRSVEEAERLAKLADETGCAQMISFNRRFCTPVIMARQWLARQDRSRKPQLLLARMLRHDRTEPQFVEHTGIHLVDTALALMGRPQRIDASVRGTDRPSRGLFLARMGFDGNAAGMLIIAPTAGIVEETYEILGPDYQIIIDSHAHRVAIHDKGERVTDWHAEPEEHPVRHGGAPGEVEAFVEALETGGPFRPNLEDGLVAMRAAAAIQRGDSVTFA